MKSQFPSGYFEMHPLFNGTKTLTSELSHYHSPLAAENPLGFVWCVHVSIMGTSGLWCVHISALEIISTLLSLYPFICLFDSHLPSILHCHRPLPWGPHRPWSDISSLLPFSDIHTFYPYNVSFSVVLSFSLSSYHLTPSVPFGPFISSY